MHLRFARQQAGEHAAESQRLVRELGANPAVAGGRGVPLGEDQVHDPEHARRAARSTRSDRAPRTEPAPRESVFFARTMRCCMVATGTRNMRAISSVLRPPTMRSVSATCASRERTGWQAVKTSRSRSSSIGCQSSSTRLRQVAGDRAVPVVEPLPAPPAVDRLALRDGREPGARIRGTPDSGHCDERVGDRLLREILGEADVARHLGERRDDARPFDAPDGVDRAPDVRHRDLRCLRLVSAARLGAPALLPSGCTRCRRSRRSRSRR